MISPARSKILVQLVLVYYLALGSLVAITISFPVSVYAGHDSLTPTAWLWLLWVFYYVVPPAVSLFYGWAFRPFWQNFRNVFLLIMLGHGLYSVGVFGAREMYLNGRTEAVDKGREGRLAVTQCRHTLEDVDDDGRVDRAEFVMQVDVRQFPRGDYSLYATPAQSGIELPEGRAGVYHFKISPPIVTESMLAPLVRDPERLWHDLVLNGYLDRRGRILKYFQQVRVDAELQIAPRHNYRRNQIYNLLLDTMKKHAKVFDARFSVDLRGLREHLAQGDLELNVTIGRDQPLDRWGKRILALSRWCPFLRTTRWDGVDNDLRDRVVELDTERHVDSLSVRPMQPDA